MTELDKLIKAVEGGRAKYTDFTVFACDGLQMPNDGRAHAAYRGDLNAAWALHKAIAPQFLVQEFEQNSRSMGWNILLVNEQGNYISSHGGGDVGFVDCPARAWLLGVLKAYRSLQ